MDNLELWNSVADIDPKYTKAITGKDYRGTSPNPTYMIKLATEKLGRVGEGFGWRVLADGFQPFGDTTLHFCRIEFWWRGKDGERHSFENYGQTKAAYTTRNGDARVDEDAPKKSLTDAITKSLSHLGFAGNIFLGLWDDSKYVSEVAEEYRKKDAPKADSRPAAKPAQTGPALVVEGKDARDFANKIMALFKGKGEAHARNVLAANGKGMSRLEGDAPAMHAEVMHAASVEKDGPAQYVGAG